MLQPLYGGARRGRSRPTTTRSTATLYLRIATELYLKRCIVGGLERVYELGKDFRNEGVSHKHNPEFTMLEWYEAYADYEDIAARARGARRRAAEAVGYAGELDFTPPWRRVTLADAIRGARPASTSSRRATARRSPPRSRRGGLDDAPSRHVGRSSSTICSPSTSSRRCIEPTIRLDYPVELSPFAKRHRDDAAAWSSAGRPSPAGWRSRTPSPSSTTPTTSARASRQQRAPRRGRRRGGAALRRGVRRRRSSRACRRPAASASGIDRLVMVLTGPALDPRGRAVPRDARLSAGRDRRGARAAGTVTTARADVHRESARADGW